MEKSIFSVLCMLLILLVSISQVSPVVADSHDVHIHSISIEPGTVSTLSAFRVYVWIENDNPSKGYHYETWVTASLVMGALAIESGYIEPSGIAQNEFAFPSAVLHIEGYPVPYNYTITVWISCEGTTVDEAEQDIILVKGVDEERIDSLEGDASDFALAIDALKNNATEMQLRIDALLTQNEDSEARLGQLEQINSYLQISTVVLALAIVAVGLIFCRKVHYGKTI